MRAVDELADRLRAAAFELYFSERQQSAPGLHAQGIVRNHSYVADGLKPVACV